MPPLLQVLTFSFQALASVILWKRLLAMMGPLMGMFSVTHEVFSQFISSEQNDHYSAMLFFSLSFYKLIILQNQDQLWETLLHLLYPFKNHELC